MFLFTLLLQATSTMAELQQAGGAGEVCISRLAREIGVYVERVMGGSAADDYDSLPRSADYSLRQTGVHRVPPQRKNRANIAPK